LTLAFIFGLARAVSGYSVLTHEEIVDMLWNDEIQPLLLKRFPGVDAERDEAAAQALAADSGRAGTVKGGRLSPTAQPPTGGDERKPLAKE
jgi:hypothetical protein